MYLDGEQSSQQSSFQSNPAINPELKDAWHVLMNTKTKAPY